MSSPASAPRTSAIATALFSSTTADQDRSLWDAEQIADGRTALDRARWSAFAVPSRGVRVRVDASV